MSIKLKALLEGYAWERKADGSLPTLKDAIAVHEANSSAKPDFLDLDGDGNEKESMKSAAADSGAYKDATRNELASHISQLSTELRNETDPRKQRIIKQDLEDAKKQLEVKKKSVNEYGENDFDRSSQMYGGGKSSRESNGDVSEIVEKLEDVLDRCMQDLSTNSNVPASEKSVILRQLIKMSDLINELQDNI